MPFGLCNAPGTFQRCIMEGKVLGHLVSKRGIEVDKAKVEVIEKLPPPRDVRGIRSFLGHADFYRRFIKDFSKIARPLTNLLCNDTKFQFDEECLLAFEKLKKTLARLPLFNLRIGICHLSSCVMQVIMLLEWSLDKEWTRNFTHSLY
ncbi:unnamed protein product [Rhodiola kirilowii]